jgi:hypothetical protein
LRSSRTRTIFRAAWQEGIGFDAKRPVTHQDPPMRSTQGRGEAVREELGTRHRMTLSATDMLATLGPAAWPGRKVASRSPSDLERRRAKPWIRHGAASPRPARPAEQHGDRGRAPAPDLEAIRRARMAQPAAAAGVDPTVNSSGFRLLFPRSVSPFVVPMSGSK